MFASNISEAPCRRQCEAEGRSATDAFHIPIGILGDTYRKSFKELMLCIQSFFAASFLLQCHMPV